MGNGDAAAYDRLMELKKAYSRVFESPDGKQVLAHIERASYCKSTTFSDNPLIMARNEGRRQVILNIKSMMDLDPERMKNLLNEQGGG